MPSACRAVIDVGTNSVKLLVAEVAGVDVRPLLEASVQTRLGRGFYDDHLLQPDAIAQTAEAVAAYAQQAEACGAQSTRVIATSAARDAKNQDELLAAIRRASRLTPEVISGEQEAEWVFRGVGSDPKWRGQRLLILDVGGGSTEFILGERGHHSLRRSFPLGSVRLLEQLRPGEPPSLHDLASCRQWLDDFLARDVGPTLGAQLRDAAGAGAQLIGTGGATTILARMTHGLENYDRARIEATRLSRRQVLDFMVHLWSLPLAERRKIPGLPPNRADVILMGVAIYEAVMRHFHFTELGVSTRGLRFGALLEPDAGPADAAASADPARGEFLTFMRAWEDEPEHVLHVARLALRLFDGLAPLHGLGARERLLLEAAACLHDIGHRTKGPGREHHKESARLIRGRRWEHLSPREAELVAQVARYHRRSLPQPKHGPFAALPPEEQAKVRQLAALLRVADGLERSHQQVVTDLRVAIDDGRVAIHLFAARFPGQEIAAATEKSDLAQIVFARPFVFTAELTTDAPPRLA